MTYKDDTGRFDIGRVITRTTSALRPSIIPYAIGSILLLGVGPAAYSYCVAYYRLTNTPGEVFGLGAVAFIPYIGLSVVLSGSMLHHALKRFTGSGSTLSEDLAVAGARFLPLLGLSILQAVLVILATLLLVIPGLIVWTMLAVAQPILVVERSGVMASLGRSRERTRGHRWAVFAVLVIYVALTLAAGIPDYVSRFNSDDGSVIWILAGLSAIATGLLNVVSTVGVMALYVELRNLRESFADETADVFF